MGLKLESFKLEGMAFSVSFIFTHNSTDMHGWDYKFSIQLQVFRPFATCALLFFHCFTYNFMGLESASSKLKGMPFSVSFTFGHISTELPQ
jgi:hypothetical protein